MTNEQAIEVINGHIKDSSIAYGTFTGQALRMAIEALKAQFSQEDATSDLQSTCNDAISRKAVKDLLIYNWDECCSACIGEVEEMPPAQPERAIPSVLNNQVNLCDSCTYTYPECPSEINDIIFGNGFGNDNICACNKYQPSVQPVATDATSDTISRQAAIDALDEQIRQCDKALSAFDISLKEEYAVKVERASLVAFRETLEYMPTAKPERNTGHWILYDKRFPWSKDYKCSECGNYINISDINVGRGSVNFCPNCGAKMKGVKGVKAWQTKL